MVARDLNGFKNSVAIHKGYYIARYEASNGGDGKPNSKVAAPWNNITQPNAAIAARNMYDSSYGAISDLVNSYAWDMALVFIQRYSGDTDYSQEINYNFSAGSLGNTGTKGDERCHIHDMLLNYFEWTTETYNDSIGPCVCRGGVPEKQHKADGRGRTLSSTFRYDIAFRSILYL